MKLYMTQSFVSEGWSEIPAGERHELPVTGGQLRIYFEGDEPAEVLANDVVITIADGATDVMLPCIPNASGTLTIRCSMRDGAQLRYQFFRDPALMPEQTFLHACVDFRRRLQDICVQQSIYARQVYDAITHGELSLLAQEHLLSAVDDDWHLDRIQQTLGHLMAVCRKPRQHLRVDEAVRPVAVVTRTGPAALRHLASHSEHWGTRTVSGLKPGRLLAQVIEDDLELYENRFVKTLIDRLIAHVGRARQEIEQALEQNENALRWDELAQEFHDHRRRDMLRILAPSTGMNEIRDSHNRFEERKRVLNEVQGVLAACVGTRFYQSLRHCERVAAPLRMTNILRMDPHYEPLVALWLMLDQAKGASEAAVDGLLPSDAHAAYSIYCYIVLVTALQFADFRSPKDDDQSIGFFTSNGQFEGRAVFCRGDWAIEVWLDTSTAHPQQLRMLFRRTVNDVEIWNVLPQTLPRPEQIPAELRAVFELLNNHLIIKRHTTAADRHRLATLRTPDAGNDSPIHKRRRSHREPQRGVGPWQRFVTKVFQGIDETASFEIRMFPILFTFGQEPAELNEHTAQFLDSATTHTERQDIRSTLIFTPSSLPRTNDSIPAAVVRRILNYGDSFVQGDANRWGNRRSGMLLISPWQINSLLRCVRLVNTYTVGEDIRAGRKVKVCPICKSMSIRMTKDGLDECLACGAQWGQTQCPNDACEHRFGWLRPRTKDKSQASNDAPSYSLWIGQLENIASYNAIVAFCESPSERPAARPICPRCGTCSHAKECIDCRRCSGGHTNGV